MLLHEKILIVLHGGGPRTNSEIASILSVPVNSVRTANSQNVQMSLVSFKREGKGESKMGITPHGITRIRNRLASNYVVPPSPTPIRDKLIPALREGLSTLNWNTVVNSRVALYKWIILLQKEGYIISKKRDKQIVTYKIILEPLE